MRNAVIGLVAIALVGCDRDEGTGALTPVAPHILAQPRSASVVECEGATFETFVSGTPPLTFRWFADEVEVPGANERALVLPRVGSASDGTRIRVLVSNAAGEASSGEAMLTVTAAEGPRVLVDDHVLGGLVSDGDEVLWTNGLGVNAAPLDCDQPIRAIYSRASERETTYALAITRETVVWTDYVAGTVKAAETDGTALRILAAGLPALLTAVVSDAERSYWIGSGGSGLQTAPLGGDGPVTTLAPGPIESWALALDDEYVYVLEWPDALLRVDRANGAATVLAGGLSNATGLAVAGAYAYWTETLAHDSIEPVGLVRRMSRDGGEPELVASHTGKALVLATDGTHVYWTIQASNGDRSGAVARALLDGSGAVEYIASGLDGPFDLTLAGSLVVWHDGRGIRTLSKPPPP